jgi:formylglycine-generating enzyme required for sulfatase activity
MVQELKHAVLAIALLACISTTRLAGTNLDAAETVTNSIGLKLVRVPAGEFMMGAEESHESTLIAFPYCDPAWLAGDLPRHKVRITKDFYIGQYEVTLAQLLTFRERAHYKTEAERDGKPKWGYDRSLHLVESADFRPWSPGWPIKPEHPAVYVSWNDAMEFCQWLSQIENKRYRLPTEAEWEYTCRAGTCSRFYCGDDPETVVRFGNVADHAMAMVFVNSKITAWKDGKAIDSDIPFPYLHHSDGYVWTAPVGSFVPNDFGVYDMHGNVWEWCSDWYSESWYRESPVDDPKGPTTGTTRVVRGGGFHYPPVRMRCAARNHADPSGRGYHGGFRVVCEVN